MEIVKYQKKPVVIEAVQVTEDNIEDIWKWLGDNGTEAFLHRDFPQSIVIQTLEGMMSAYVGSYVIKGVEGEFYPCKESVFDSSYDMLAL